MKFMTILLLLLTILSAHGQQAEQTIPSKPVKVTLYLSGALVTRAAQTTLKAGLTDLVFSNLSDNIDPATIRVNASGQFTIISVNHRTNFLKPQVSPAESESIQKRIKEIEGKLEEVKKDQDILATEDLFLKANMHMGLPDKGATSAEVKLAADFFKERYTAINNKKLELDRSKTRLEEELEKLKGQAGGQSEADIKPTGEIVVEVTADKPVQATFNLSYAVRNASWNPEFDLRVDNIASPMQLSRRAKIRQQSGEQWNDVDLTLSTGNPTQSGIMPFLSTWYLGGNPMPRYASVRKASPPSPPVIDKPSVYYAYNGSIAGRVYDAATNDPLPGVSITIAGTNTGAISNEKGNYSIKAPYNSTLKYSFIGYNMAETRTDNPVINVGLQPSVMALDEVVVVGYGEAKSTGSMAGEDKSTPVASNLQISKEANTRSSREYHITMPLTLQTDNKEYNLVIGEDTINTDYEFHAVPKLDRDAFLLARIKDWQDYDFLNASAGVFYEGTYTGKTYLSTSVTKDTLDVSLGRDKSILIERKSVKDFTSNQLLGSKRITQRGIEISVRNNKKQAVKLILDDQIPVSRVNDIEVELTEGNGARLEKETGLLRWELNLNPGQAKKILFRYTVRYPKDKYINID